MPAWTNAEMLETLTSPDVAKDLWHSGSCAAEALRREFGWDEQWFLGYVRALHERNVSGPTDVKIAWASPYE